MSAFQLDISWHSSWVVMMIKNSFYACCYASCFIVPLMIIIVIFIISISWQNKLLYHDYHFSYILSMQISIKFSNLYFLGPITSSSLLHVKIKKVFHAPCLYISRQKIVAEIYNELTSISFMYVCNCV